VTKKRNILIVSSIILGGIVLIVFLVYFYGFVLSYPEYDSKYFTPEYIKKYESAEKAFNHFINAITLGDISYYQEVIGRTMSDEERNKFKTYYGERPKIEKIDMHKNHAYIVTDNNWGSHFENVKGRWVFSPEDWGVLIRNAYN